MSPEELCSRKDLSVVVSVYHDLKNEILQILKSGGYPEKLVFTLDGFGNIDSCNDQYFRPDFITYEDEEIFVDAGCFNLRSSLALREHCTRVKKVYAFEPNPENYKVCQRNKERYHFPEAEILPFGTWSEEKALHFNAQNNGSSGISEEGEISVPVKAIDEVIHAKDRVTFIKMDVEGSELESLKGAQKTIQRDKPKLAICIYHKPEDMTEIPLYIKSLVPEYKIYNRHHTNRSVDTVLYAVMP